MTIAFVSLSIVFVAELTAFVGLLVVNRELKKERLDLMLSWEDLAKTAGEVKEVAEEVSKEQVKLKTLIPDATAEVVEGSFHGRIVH